MGATNNLRSHESNRNCGEAATVKELRGLTFIEQLQFVSIFMFHSIFQQPYELRIFIPLYNEEIMLIITYPLSGAC